MGVVKEVQFIADLHLHSKYSRATSKDLTIPNNALWAKRKGIDVVGTGDFTHPVWFSEVRENLKEDPVRSGLFQLSDSKLNKKLGDKNAPRFLLTVETSHIYSQNGKTHKVHLVTLAPSFETVEKIQQGLIKHKINISSDGRPIMGMSCPNYMDLVLTIDENCLIYPTHIWTPWFSMFGSMSGFDSVAECFDDFAPLITAIESGLSSDPMMNWRIPDLDNKAIVSFSDAHSPSKLGREVTVFQGEESYWGIVRAMGSKTLGLSADNSEAARETKIASTVEFYPEEGKYHYSGHRNCEVVLSPQETKTRGEKCLVCGKPLTLGVMHRVAQLATREVNLDKMKIDHDENGVRWINTPKGLKPPYTMLVPLQEILAEVLDKGEKTKAVQEKYDQMVDQFGSEFAVLLTTSLEEIEKSHGEKTAEAIRRVRCGEIRVDPGYDGEFGKVRIFEEEKPCRLS